MTTMLAVENVTMRFGGLFAVKNVSMTVEKDSITALIGPNGAGKTTLFNVVSGIYRATGGRIMCKGISLNEVDLEQKVRVGIARTFQNICLFPTLSVIDNVRIGMHSRGSVGIIGAILKTRQARQEEKEMSDRAMHCLTIVGLENQAGGLAKNLPYGAQRRLEIARALAAEPDILLLDEPAAGMNIRETRDLTGLIMSIRSELKKTIFLIEHDMKLVMPISDKVVVLDHGEKIAEGVPKEIQNNAQVIESYLGKGRVKHA